MSYDWNIGGRKITENIVFGLVGFGLSILTQMPQTETVIAVIVLLNAFKNWWSHR